MDKSEALLIAYALENDLEDYAGQSLPRISQDIADSAAVELRRLHAENERLTAQRDALLEALKEVLAWGTDQNYVRAEAACDKARAAIKAVDGTK